MNFNYVPLQVSIVAASALLAGMIGVLATLRRGHWLVTLLFSSSFVVMAAFSFALKLEPLWKVTSPLRRNSERRSPMGADAEGSARAWANRRAKAPTPRWAGWAGVGRRGGGSL